MPALRMLPSTAPDPDELDGLDALDGDEAGSSGRALVRGAGRDDDDELSAGACHRSRVCHPA